MPVFIPCLNPDKPDGGGGFSVGVGVGPTSGEVTGIAPGVSFTHSDSPISLTVIPVPPFIFFGPNFAFWSDLFGLGETRIDREKQQIQDILTALFQFLNYSYGVPIRDGHALQFPSDGVRAQFVRRPDIAALVPSLMTTSETVTRLVFADSDTSQGQRERVVNQYLANAAINDWPVNATVQIWEGMLQASRPECSADPERWLKNPEIVVVAAELAVILQYIDLWTLTNMATSHAIGNPMAERLILLWANNPSLVGDIPHRDAYDWQRIYSRGEWRLSPWATPFGDIVPLYRRQHIMDLLAGVSVKRPRYPDFADPGDGGIQSQPQPAPQPAPQPQPQPEPTPQPQPEPTPVPQPPSAPPPTQPYPPTPPPQPAPPPGEQVLEIPNQQEYERACDISRRFGSGLTVSEEDLNWITTVIGSKAISWAVNEPRCGYFVQSPNGPLPDPSQPDCPPYQPPTQTPIPVPPYVPQPYPPYYPQPQPRDRDGKCDPDCEDQIELIRQRQKECCDTLYLGVMPRLDNIEWWLIDVERRLPGPQPPLPHPEPVPPYFPEPPTVPPTEPPTEGPPGEGTPPTLPPECIDRLKELCEPDALCQKVRECERELECVEVPLCDEAGGPWGAMAECWLGKNTPVVEDVEGIYAARQYPRYGVSQIVYAWQRKLYQGGQQRGMQEQAPTLPSEQSPQGHFYALLSPVVSKIVDSYRGAEYLPSVDPTVQVEERTFVYVDETEQPPGKLKVRSLKLRPGEVDPCDVEPPQVLEIPPVGATI